MKRLKGGDEYDEVFHKTDEEKLEESSVKRLEEENVFLRKQMSEYERILEKNMKSALNDPQQTHSFLPKRPSSDAEARIRELRCVKIWKIVAVLAILCFAGSMIWHANSLYHRFDQERKETHENHRNQLNQERSQCIQDVEKRLADQRQQFDQEKKNLISNHYKNLEEQKLRSDKQFQEEFAKVKSLYDQLIKEVQNQCPQLSARTEAPSQTFSAASSGTTPQPSVWATVSSAVSGFFVKIFGKRSR